MSKTDKDRPYWVKAHDYGHVRHDHRHGECRVETPENARDYTYNKFGFNHSRRCNKRVAIEYTCTKAQPEEWGRYRYAGDRYHWGYRIVKCWSWHPAGMRTGNNGVIAQPDVYSYYPSDYRSRRHQCRGHVRWEWDNSIACICDEKNEPPTCDVVLDYHEFNMYGAVPNSFIHEVWTGPERRRERDELNRMRGEYNAHGDIDDYDFANNQHRHNASWFWW